MKKALLALGLIGLLGVGTRAPVGTYAAGSTIYGQNIFPNGDFSLASGEYVIPETMPSSGVIAGYAKWSWDVAPKAVVDPNDATNTVLVMPQAESGAGFSSMFKMLSIESGATYNVSFDYRVDGTTDNIGLAFYNTTDGNRLPEYQVMDATVLETYGITVTTLENGFNHVSFQRTFEAGKTYDSAHIWGNVGSGSIYLDNYSLVKVDTTENIFTGGDFEGFLEYGLPALTEEPNTYGLFGTNAVLEGGGLSLASGTSTYGGLVEYSANVHEFSITIPSTIASGANLNAVLSDSAGTAIETEAVISDGVFNGTDNVYTADFASSTTADRLYLSYSGDAAIRVDAISLRAKYESPYDPSFDYYEGPNMTVNGDFEAFDVGTVFSETQLEGAWGSVSLDNPARITEDLNSHVATIGKIDATDTKTYSSMFLMTPDTLSIGDIVRLRYDYKLVMNSDPENYAEINSCLVGGSNTSYYLIDLRKLAIDETYTMTSGAETTPYPLKYETLDNGYIRVTMDWVITSDMIQWNSVRWLYPALEVGETLSIDNVEMHQLYTEEPSVVVTGVDITDGDIELAVGESKTLTATVTPSDATDKTLTWSSGNTAVATVDSAGKVTAVASGTAEITATASNGVKDSIVVTVTEAPEPTPSGGGGVNVGLIVGLVIGGVVLVGAIIAIVVVLRKRKHQ